MKSVGPGDIFLFFKEVRLCWNKENFQTGWDRVAKHVTCVKISEM